MPIQIYLYTYTQCQNTQCHYHVNTNIPNTNIPNAKIPNAIIMSIYTMHHDFFAQKSDDKLVVAFTRTFKRILSTYSSG